MSFEVRTVRWMDGHRISQTQEAQTRGEAEHLLEAERLEPGELAYAEIIETPNPKGGST
jgi:hypothetical protein